MALLVAEIHWPGADVDPSAAIAERLGVSEHEIVEWQLIRRSVDGRRRPPRWLAERLPHDRAARGVHDWRTRD